MKTTIYRYIIERIKVEVLKIRTLPIKVRVTVREKRKSYCDRRLVLISDYLKWLEIWMNSIKENKFKNTEPEGETTTIKKKKTVRRFLEGKWIDVEVEVQDDGSVKIGISTWGFSSISLRVWHFFWFSQIPVLMQ